MTVHPGAEVAQDVVLGGGTTVWPLAQIREGARLGANCIVWRGAYVGSGVVMGDNCKLQNHSAGASIGARAVCVAPLTIGRWALVAAGSVVTENVADFSLVAGVPARHIRWVGKAAFPYRVMATRGDVRRLGGGSSSPKVSSWRTAPTGRPQGLMRDPPLESSCEPQSPIEGRR